MIKDRATFIRVRYYISAKLTLKFDGVTYGGSALMLSIQGDSVLMLITCRGAHVVLPSFGTNILFRFQGSSV